VTGKKSPTLAAVSSPPQPELPTGESKVETVRAMFDTIAPRYDLMNRLLTARLDVNWRRRAVSELGLGSGSLVADLACGTGDLCADLARADLVPIGFDLSAGMLARAHTRAPLVQADVLRLPLGDQSVDGVTCGFALRNLVALEPYFVETARVVRPGGRMAILEVAEPDNRLLRAGHSVYFGKVVPWIGARLSDAEAYGYLPRSVAYLPDPQHLIAMAESAGFGSVQRTALFGGVAQLLTATRLDDNEQADPRERTDAKS